MLTKKAVDHQRFEKSFDIFKLVVNPISKNPAIIKYIHAIANPLKPKGNACLMFT